MNIDIIFDQFTNKKANDYYLRLLFYFCSFSSIQINSYHWLAFYHDHQEQNRLAGGGGRGGRGGGGRGMKRFLLNNFFEL